MVPIGSVGMNAVRPVKTVEETQGAAGIRRPEEEAQGRPRRPAMDVYAPEEKREPCGRYWMGRDEDGQPKIYFDDPERAAEMPKQPEAAPAAGRPDADAPEAAEPRQGSGARGPEKGDGEKEERCVGNTDKVDREIEQLKKKRQELEQKLNTETDEGRVKDLERQLAQVERELRQKDNDTYRKRHSTFTQLT